MTYSQLFLKHTRLARLDTLGFDAPCFRYLPSKKDTLSLLDLNQRHSGCENSVREQNWNCGWATLAVPEISLPFGRNSDRCDLIASLYPPLAALRLFAYRLRLALSESNWLLSKNNWFELNKRSQQKTTPCGVVFCWLPLLDLNQRPLDSVSVTTKSTNLLILSPMSWGTHIFFTRIL